MSGCLFCKIRDLVSVASNANELLKCLICHKLTFLCKTMCNACILLLCSCTSAFTHIAFYECVMNNALKICKASL